jgi:hypothetical protein
MSLASWPGCREKRFLCLQVLTRGPLRLARFGIIFPTVDRDIRPQRTLQRAIEQLLRPLFRVLLRHSVSYGAFEDMAKRVYVDVALKDFGLPGKKPSTSRVAVLSGLTRKEVQRLLSEPEDEAAEVADRYNRAARVLSGWARDRDFLDTEGAPRMLAQDGEHGFAELVKRYSGDIPARAVLDELVRVGSVVQRPDGLLQLLTNAYVPQNSTVDKLGILGRDVADLIDTIDHNLEHGSTQPRFQRKVMYDAIPPSALPAFRKLSAQQSQALLEKFDRWLAAKDLDQSPQEDPGPRVRVGVGIYYFEEHLEPSVVEGVSP